ncbi:hypothetical protein DCD74_09335 [Lysobacter oculi]|uniref:Long-chain fatty acid transporter n=1 Tax=Solilutibacter oculi TaxID=2698682 RepID=A0A344J747_9GAMM|nr:outer membrane protein transport protein [Lysobacter oculi]AXA84857.1 hypothetical protein DCD74_09335 [Lysobacter oculi]
MQHASRQARLSALAVAVIGALVVGNAAASGFQIRENSIKTLGRAFTGTTVAQDDATVAITNPAAMTNLTSTTVVSNASFIDLNGDFTGTALTGAPFATNANPAIRALAKPATGGNGGDPGDVAAVPSFAVVMPLSGSFENLWVGFGVNAPYGLKTEWDKDWVGRYNAVTSDVKVVDATLSAAWKPSDQFSIGAGVIFQRAEVTLTNALDLGTAVCGQLAAGATTPAGAAAFTSLCLNPATAAYGPGRNDGFFEVSGKDNGIGFIIGMQWKPTDKFSVGYAYKSEIDHELKGAVDFTVPANVLALPGMSARFADGAGGAALTTPSTHTFSALYKVTDSVRLLGEYQRTSWSSLRNVTILRGATQIGVEEYHWSDSNMYSLGAEFDLSPAFTLRAGVGRDETPTHDANRTPRLPDNDRTLLSLGATWHATSNISVDAAFMRVNLKEAPINSVSSTGTLLTGKVEGHANIFGIGASYKF